MSAFNVVIVPWQDPITHKEFELRVQFKYGDVWQYVYQIGEILKWGGNDIGRKEAGRVVVDGCLEGEPPVSEVPEDFEVHILKNKIDKVVPATGAYDFVSANDSFVVVED